MRYGFTIAAVAAAVVCSVQAQSMVTVTGHTTALSYYGDNGQSEAEALGFAPGNEYNFKFVFHGENREDYTLAPFELTVGSYNIAATGLIYGYYPFFFERDTPSPDENYFDPVARFRFEAPPFGPQPSSVDFYIYLRGPTTNSGYNGFFLDTVVEKFDAPFFSRSVPEPATWAMMIGGFGFVGFSARHRRTVGRVTFA